MNKKNLLPLLLFAVLLIAGCGEKPKAVEGVVYDAVTEEPMGNVAVKVVKIYKKMNGEPAPNKPEKLLQQTVTDADGRFSMSFRRPADNEDYYVIVDVTASGLLSRGQEDSTRITYGSKNYKTWFHVLPRSGVRFHLAHTDCTDPSDKLKIYGRPDIYGAPEVLLYEFNGCGTNESPVLPVAAHQLTLRYVKTVNGTTTDYTDYNTFLQVGEIREISYSY